MEITSNPLFFQRCFVRVSLKPAAAIQLGSLRVTVPLLGERDFNPRKPTIPPGKPKPGSPRFLTPTGQEAPTSLPQV